MLKPQCVSTSLRLRLYSPREWIQKALSLRETGGGGDRQVQRHEKRKDTHRERKMIFFLASKTKTKDFNLAARKRQPLLIESGIKIRFTCEE